ncbi:MAG: hypothetical protein ACXVEF_43550 [Polyangiales bacterium]
MVSALPDNSAKTMFVEILIEGITPTDAVTSSNVNAWIKGLSVPFTTLFDADPASFTTEKVFGVKETTYIVERTTMKIVAKATTPEAALTTLATLPP